MGLSLKFPKDRVYPRKRRPFFLPLLLLLAMLAAAWFYAQSADQRERIDAGQAKLVVMDGDSFAIGTRKLRLDGIDAPEYKQNCKDAKGADWPCGLAAKASLQRLLLAPGLSCLAEVHDRYNRSLATCSTDQTPDIGAQQVADGYAVSHEFNELRDYGKEEDAARAARRGIWQGEFTRPEEWRTAHPRASGL